MIGWSIFIALGAIVLVVSWAMIIKKKSPPDEMEVALQNLQEAKLALVSSRNLISSVKAQIGRSQRESERLEKKVEEYLKNGDRTRATDYAVLLKSEEQNLESFKAKLLEYTQRYEERQLKVEYIKRSIDQIRRNVENLRVDLKFSKLELEASRINENLKIGKLGDEQEELKKQIDLNRAEAALTDEINQVPQIDYKQDVSEILNKIERKIKESN